jgi:hypothetical protein
MNKRALNRRESGLNMISSATKVMAVGAIGLTGSVALLADHIYNVQHSATAHAATATQSSTPATSFSTSGDDGLSTGQAPSAASSSVSSGGGSGAIVSGGS